MASSSAMLPYFNAAYDLYATAAAEEAKQSGGGITAGVDDSSAPTSKTYTAAEERMIPNTHFARNLALSFDALAQNIIQIQEFSILGDYKVTTDDDEFTKELEHWIDYDINMMQAFRASFECLKTHQKAHLQKLYKEQITAPGEGQGLLWLQKLEKVQRFSDPFNITNYGFYQKLKIAKEWRDPEATDLNEQKVWFLPDGEKGEFSNVNEAEDKIFNRNHVLEFKNGENATGGLGTCLNEIFLKKLIFMGLPSLIKIVVTPGINLTYDSMLINPKTGEPIWIAPLPPDDRFDTDMDSYNAKLALWNAWTANMQTKVNTYADNRYNKGYTVMPSFVKENVIQSTQSLDSDMLHTMVTMLNTEIAWALGFSIALIDAQGTELATSRSILATIAPMLRGVQKQYAHVAKELIREQFGDRVDKANLKFTLSELIPDDEHKLAQVRKFNAEALEILNTIGANEDTLKLFAARYDLIDDMEFNEAKSLEATAEQEPYTLSELEHVNALVIGARKNNGVIALEME